MRPSSSGLEGWSVSDRRQVQRVSDGTLKQTVLAPGLTTSPERAEACDHRDRAGVCLSAPGAAREPSDPPIGEMFSEM
jgi:hypothetical protein